MCARARPFSHGTDTPPSPTFVPRIRPMRARERGCIPGSGAHRPRRAPRRAQITQTTFYSGYLRPFDGSVAYPRAGVCKYGGQCYIAGQEAAGSTTSFGLAVTGCALCNPLLDQAASSELSYPKYCYRYTDKCDLDVACAIAEQQCGSGNPGNVAVYQQQFFRIAGVTCAAPEWSTEVYGYADLSPYASPWDFRRSGDWEYWERDWVEDQAQSTYYLVQWPGASPPWPLPWGRPLLCRSGAGGAAPALCSTTHHNCQSRHFTTRWAPTPPDASYIPDVSGPDTLYDTVRRVVRCRTTPYDICVCVCVCVYKYIFMYMYTHTHTHTHTYISVDTVHHK